MAETRGKRIVMSVASLNEASFGNSTVEEIAEAMEDEFGIPVVAVAIYDKTTTQLSAIIDSDALDENEYCTMSYLIENMHSTMPLKTFAALLQVEGLADCLISVDMDRPEKQKVHLFYGSSMWSVVH
jgi:hypothetical protein